MHRHEEKSTLDRAVVRLASQFHENWRANRIQENGLFLSDIEATTDELWIAENGTDQVDIANRAFDALPSDWQKENLAAAEVAQGLLNQGLSSEVDVTSDEFIEGASSSIHDAWLERNKLEAGGVLDVPYEKLPEEEKARDRAQILTAVEFHLHPGEV